MNQREIWTANQQSAIRFQLVVSTSKLLMYLPLKDQAVTNNDDKIIVPLETMKKKITGENNSMVIYASVKDSNEMGQAQREVEMTLPHHLKLFSVF